MCVCVCFLGQLVASGSFPEGLCSTPGRALWGGCPDACRDEERMFPPLFHNTQHISGTLRASGDQRHPGIDLGSPAEEGHHLENG